MCTLTDVGRVFVTRRVRAAPRSVTIVVIDDLEDAMTDSLSRLAGPAIVHLEHELIVRDFLDLLDGLCWSELRPFLHDDVVFVTAPGRTTRLNRIGGSSISSRRSSEREFTARLLGRVD